jgi:hypothetical protein
MAETTTALAAPDAAGAEIERVVIGGDLKDLKPTQRVAYYMGVCESLGLNWRTRPFEFIVLNGKLTLYARKDCADQLRKIHNISIEKPDIQFQEDWIVVTVLARNANGRTDSDVGVVNKRDMKGDYGNALMKAVTKAKRRVTLSICGLGMLDETEVETVPNAKPVRVDSSTGEIVGEVQPEVPVGFEEWAEAMTAVAECGAEAFRKEWKLAKPEYRRAVKPMQLDDWKARATKADEGNRDAA